MRLLCSLCIPEGSADDEVNLITQAADTQAYACTEQMMHVTSRSLCKGLLAAGFGTMT